MNVSGYRLVKKSDSSIVSQWTSVPSRIEVVGLRVDGVSPGWQDNSFLFEAAIIVVPDPPPPPTNSEIYDSVITTQAVLKAVVLSLNDGTFVPGSNKTGAQLKAIIGAKM